jgi:hypothetical protein
MLTYDRPLLLNDFLHTYLQNDEVKAAWKRLCQRKYHVHCCIVNDTDKEINYTNEKYFNSGSLFIAPDGPIPPKSKVTFGVGGGSYSGDALRSIAMGAVSGGMKFSIDGGPTFSVGFTDPIIGSRKAGVSMGGSPTDGYNAASDKGNSGSKDGFTVVATVDSDKRLAKYVVKRG